MKLRHVRLSLDRPQANPALVTVLDDARHGLDSGAVVQFDGLDGMEELNGRQFTITFKDAYRSV